MNDLPAITLRELLAYDEHEVTRWHEWLKRQPAEILDIRTTIAEGDDLRWLLFHIFAVQLRYAEWLLGYIPAERTSALRPSKINEDFMAMPHQTLEELFAIGQQARKLLSEFAEKATVEELAKTLTYKGPIFQLSATKRKVFVHAILHGEHHWAQIAVLVREAGHKTDWVHDFIVSPAMD